MSTLNDTKKNGNVLLGDIEKAIWQLQESRDYGRVIALGSVGKYAIQLTTAKDFYPVKSDGEKSDRKLPHYVYLTQKEEVTAKGIGLVTGQPHDFQASQSFKVDKVNPRKALQAYFGLFSKNKASWKNFWRLAIAINLGFDSIEESTGLRKDYGLNNDEKLAFAVKHCQKMNPTMLELAYIRQHGQSADNQAQEADSAKLHVNDVPTTAMQVAMQSAEVIA